MLIQGTIETRETRVRVMGAARKGMADNISGDGIFHAVKNIHNKKLIYCMTVQLYSDGRRQTHCLQILTVLLADGT